MLGLAEMMADPATPNSAPILSQLLPLTTTYWCEQFWELSREARFTIKVIYGISLKNLFINL
jgi:hypothetical protein